MGLADQKSARRGNVLGMMGVSSGVITTLLAMNQPFPLLCQTLTGFGVALGLGINMG